MSIEAMKQALEALEEIADEVFSPYDNKLGDAILALRAAIEKAEKPWVKTYSEGKPQYTTPREWHKLTDEEIQTAWESMNHDPAAFVHFAGGALWAEAKCKEKNG